jgi:hypothetical protein
MNDVVLRLAFAVVLMILTLYVAFSFLAVPMALLRKAGVLRAVRWCVRASWRGLVWLFRLLKSRGRRRIRRFPARAFIRLFR